MSPDDREDNAGAAQRKGLGHGKGGARVTTQILVGDCFELLSQVERCDLILTDPPYGITQQEWDRPIDWRWWWNIVRPYRCPVLIFASPPFDKTLAATAPDLYRYDWIWEKPLATGHLNSQMRPLQAHESILVFYERPPTYNPQKSTGHRPVNPVYTRRTSGVYGDAPDRMHPGGQTNRFPRTVLHFGHIPPTQKRHPNEKPQDLLRYLVRTYTNPSDVVVDPFAGSGSTIEAAQAEGRAGIGIEVVDAAGGPAC